MLKSFLLILSIAGLFSACTKKACLPKSQYSKYSDVVLNQLTASGREIKFCFELQEQAKCLTVNVDNGKYLEQPDYKKNKTSRVPNLEYPRGVLKKDGVEVCHSEKQCQTVSWPDYPGPHPDYGDAVAVSASGKFLAMTNYWAKNQNTEIREIPSGKLIRNIKLKGWPGFIGETLVDYWAECAGPCTQADLLDVQTGNKIASLGDGINVDGLTPVNISEDLWVFNDGYGEFLVLQNLKNGKILKKIDITSNLKDEQGQSLANPENNILLKLSENSLGLIYSSSKSGNVVLFDHELNILKTIEAPVCSVQQET